MNKENYSTREFPSLSNKL